MKEFLKVLRRFVPPYKKYLVLTVVFNILSALLNIFSFMTIIPILNILFQTSDGMRETDWIPWSEMTLKTCTEVVSNNANVLVQDMVFDWGATTTLLIIGLLRAWCATYATNSTRKSHRCRSASSARSERETSLHA